MEKILQTITPREYQENIAKTCMNNNTLVILPTGLGKTLIALLVAIERIKKFPLQKIVMLAPTRPLAEQHLFSFKKHLPKGWADIQLFTGSVKAEKRKNIWKTADIIFSTPQCIANDLKKGLYTLENVSLLIEDEVHRCVKNYDYTYIGRRYLKESKNPRLMGLTASPGSDPKKIEEIIKNLSIETIELRTRESPDVKQYLKKLEFEKIEVELPKEFSQIKNYLQRIYEEFIEYFKLKKILLYNTSKTALLEAQKKISAQINRNYLQQNSYQIVSKLAQAIKISHAIELLETQTLESFVKYLKNLIKQAEKKQSKGVIQLVKKSQFIDAHSLALKLLNQNKEHPKIEKIQSIIMKEKIAKPNPKIIIFSQFRDTAKLISEKINQMEGIYSEIFIGQAKKEGMGLSQKEQKEIIEKFKNKKINCICATSIAEEGLDIPEVDAVIFYEPVSSAIRSIQRRGRTARLSKGKLIIMITKNTKDEFSYFASISREKKMEKEIEKIQKKLIQKKLY